MTLPHLMKRQMDVRKRYNEREKRILIFFKEHKWCVNWDQIKNVNLSKRERIQLFDPKQYEISIEYSPWKNERILMISSNINDIAPIPNQSILHVPKTRQLTTIFHILSVVITDKIFQKNVYYAPICCNTLILLQNSMSFILYRK